MQVPATDAVKARLTSALAELHTEAGWACYDAGLDGTGFFIRALRMATDAGDIYGIANAAWTAGATLVRNGHPTTRSSYFSSDSSTSAGSRPASPHRQPRAPTTLDYRPSSHG